MLQKLHERCVFQLLHGALGASGKLVETAVDASKTDASVRAIRNAVVLAELLGSINPDMLERGGRRGRRGARPP